MRVRFYFILFLFFHFSAFADTSISILSWNVRDLGNSKSASEIEYICKILRSHDVVALQEVVSGPGGTKAIAAIADILNRSGAKWDYIVSDPTTSGPYSRERYAFLWKTAKVKLRNRAFLETKYSVEIEREPFIGQFRSDKGLFTIATMHATTKKKQPEKEIKYLKYLPALYPMANWIFCGDFNLPQYHSVFNSLKAKGYHPVLVKQKTTLRQKCLNGDCLASEYDNFFLSRSNFYLVESGIIPFYKDFFSVKEARLLSDHVPIYMVISFK